MGQALWFIFKHSTVDSLRITAISVCIMYAVLFNNFWRIIVKWLIFDRVWFWKLKCQKYMYWPDFYSRIGIIFYYIYKFPCSSVEISCFTLQRISLVKKVPLFYYCLLLRELFSYTSPDNTIGKLFSREKTIICLVRNSSFWT